MTGWSDFTVVCGGAAAALVGLLFVAVTLRIDVISHAPDLRSRAAQTLTLFAVALMVSIVMTVPGQPGWLFGSEVIAIALLGGAVMLIMNKRAHSVSHPNPIAPVLGKFGPHGTTIVLIGLTGILTICKVAWGVYLLVPAELAALIGGVLSAWLFLTGSSETTQERTIQAEPVSSTPCRG